MKPAIFLLVLIIVAKTLIAQSPEAGLQAGLNYSGATGGLAENGKINFKTGFTIGLVLDFAMRKGIHFQPSVNYTQKGFGQSVNTNAVFINDFYKLNYAEFLFNFFHQSGDGVFEGIGPALSWGLSGKYHTEYHDELGQLIKQDGDVKFGDSYSQFGIKRAEVGLNGILGKEFENGVFLSANIYYAITHSVTNRNNLYFAIKLGFKINKQD